MKIARTTIENAINRCRNAEGVDGCSLPPDVRAMADIWGHMIYFRLSEIDETDVPESTKEALARWAYV